MHGTISRRLAHLTEDESIVVTDYTAARTRVIKTHERVTTRLTPGATAPIRVRRNGGIVIEREYGYTTLSTQSPTQHCVPRESRGDRDARSTRTRARTCAAVNGGRPGSTFATPRPVRSSTAVDSALQPTGGSNLIAPASAPGFTGTHSPPNGRSLISRARLMGRSRRCQTSPPKWPTSWSGQIDRRLLTGIIHAVRVTSTSVSGHRHRTHRPRVRDGVGVASRLLLDRADLRSFSPSALRVLARHSVRQARHRPVGSRRCAADTGAAYGRRACRDGRAGSHEAVLLGVSRVARCPAPSRPGACQGLICQRYPASRCFLPPSPWSGPRTEVRCPSPCS